MLKNRFSHIIADSDTYKSVKKRFDRGTIDMFEAMHLIRMHLHQVMTNVFDNSPTQEQWEEYNTAFRELCQDIGIADENGVVKIQL